MSEILPSNPRVCDKCEGTGRRKVYQSFVYEDGALYEQCDCQPRAVGTGDFIGMFITGLAIAAALGVAAAAAAVCFGLFYFVTWLLA